jgi:capsular polysaccharide export protein
MLAIRAGRGAWQATLRKADDAPSPADRGADPLLDVRRESQRPVPPPAMMPHAPLPFLRVPPFPGSRTAAFAHAAPPTHPTLTDEELETQLDAIRAFKVGGTYWGSQPPLPDKTYTLIRIRDAEKRAIQLRRLAPHARALIWLASADERTVPGKDTAVVTGVCDPWHLVGSASAVIVDADDELALIAALAGVAVECVGDGPFAALGGKPARSALQQAFRRFAAFTYFDPFSGEPIAFAEAIRCCGFWRRLIDSNRDVDGAIGFAFWKRGTVAPLLWRGSDGVRFVSRADGVGEGERIAVWRARTPAAIVSELERRKARLIEVEDGFIRSVGLGADCVPPLSIVVDRIGAHFDPGRPSELERLIEDGVFSDELLERARSLRELIIASRISKYAIGGASLARREARRRHILVPGQVEDDRAVISGGSGLTSNLELLRRVRAAAPDAYLLYKPHPDVEAGHRNGAIADELCLSVADEIVRDEPISGLLDLVDEVHVNTSLAGFEALLREKPVTTHGVPFYAGWGLTRDLGPVPPRRTARRTLDELVAAVLLLYPRYLDPVTGLPCPAEVLVRRLSESTPGKRDGIVVRLRKLQGRCRRGIAALRRSR